MKYQIHETITNIQMRLHFVRNYKFIVYIGTSKSCNVFLVTCTLIAKIYKDRFIIFDYFMLKKRNKILLVKL